jgi:glutamyl-tRNA reductase
MNGLSCLSIAGCQVSLDLLERLTYSRDELPDRLAALVAGSEALGLAVLSTCQRTEVYATWPGEPEDAALLRAIAADRDVPIEVLAAAARVHHGEAAARHLLRVASGLESFVLGETEIAGQVRAAAEISRLTGGGDVTLERLLDAAVSASRKRHQRASIAATSRSVASVAVDTVAALSGGSIAHRRLLVVGAGDVASVVVSRAAELGAAITVCNRTRRRAARFVAAGVRVVDIRDLADCLAANDIAILATAAPHPLVDERSLRSARTDAGSMIVVDLSLPRNVDPNVRLLPSVQLIDLADLRTSGASDAGVLIEDLAATEEVVENELQRYGRWLRARSAGPALRGMREDAEQIVRQEIFRIAERIPAEAHAAIEQAMYRMGRRFLHGPTRELLAAAAAGDDGLVDVFAGLFDSARTARIVGTGALPSPPDDPDAAMCLFRPLFDTKRVQPRASEYAADERGVHSTHEFAV